MRTETDITYNFELTQTGAKAINGNILTIEKISPETQTFEVTAT